MNRILPVLALALLGAAGFAAVSPLLGGGRDLTRIPADPAVVEKELAAKPISLAKAITAATKDGGVAASASFGADGQIEVTVFQGGAENAVLVDGASGVVVSKTARARFPGDAVTGEGTTTESGLRYYDVRVGDGAQAAATSTVTVHYTGWLVDSTKFDSSLDRNQTFDVVIPERRVIPGWLEGLQGMKAGGKRKLVIPSALGYGPRGTPGGPIPPNAVLVFDIEAVAVK